MNHWTKPDQYNMTKHVSDVYLLMIRSRISSIKGGYISDISPKSELISWLCHGIVSDSWLCLARQCLSWAPPLSGLVEEDLPLPPDRKCFLFTKKRSWKRSWILQSNLMLLTLTSKRLSDKDPERTADPWPTGSELWTTVSECKDLATCLANGC